MIKVDKFIFPVDFESKNLDEDVDVPLISGRSSLATSQALIDVKYGRLVLIVDREEVVFKFPEAMKHPPEFDDALFSLDDTNEVITDCMHEFTEKDWSKKHVKPENKELESTFIHAKQKTCDEEENLPNYLKLSEESDKNNGTKSNF